MEDDASIVPTSDQEELEELAAIELDYWETSTRELARRRGNFSLTSEAVLSPSTPRAKQPSSSKFDERPTKRRKLDPDVQDQNPASFLPPTKPSSLASLHSDTTPKDHSTGSPSSSPDPLSLFTPPRPGRSSPVPGHASVRSPTSSPLTPTSSPRNGPLEHDSPAAHVARAASAGPSRIQERAQPLLPPELAQEFSAEHHDGRYSLRTRQARQLNPYEYDKRMYKQQMRANPDAIVKVVSPPRPRRRHRSASAGNGNGSSGGGDEYEGAEDNAELNEDERWERRLMKSKGKAGEDGSGRANGPGWLPDVLKEGPSSGSSEEDDATFDALARRWERERRREEKEARRKEREERSKTHKARPFPLRNKDMQSPSRNEIEGSREQPVPQSRPKPRPRPRLRVAPDPAGQDVDELPPEARSWNRHRSVTFTSPLRSPPRPGHDDASAGLDNDFFPRPDSPVDLPPTPGTRTDDGASSEGHAPPPTSSTPPEVIDITSESEEGGDDLNLKLRRRPLLTGLDTSSSSPSPSRSHSGTRSGSESMNEEDRRRMKALERMMPKALINRLMQKESAAKERARRERSRSHLRGSDDGDGDDDANNEEARPLRPGESRRRIRSHTLSSRSIEIRGDSESSDVDMNVGADDPQPLSPARGSPGRASSADAQSVYDTEEIRPIGHQPRPRARSYDAPIEISEDSEDSGLPTFGAGESDSVSDHNEVGRDGAHRRSRYDGEAREGDLIDRMLSRTNMSSTRSRRKRKARVGAAGGGDGAGGGRRSHHAHGSGRRAHGGGSGGEGGGGGREGGRAAYSGGHSNGLRFTTSGAKRYGSGQQTLLPFKRLPTPDSDEPQYVEAPEPPSPEPDVVEFNQEAPKKKGKKQKSKPKPAGLYTFSSGGAHLIGGRANAAHVTVDQEVAARAGPSMRNVESHPRQKSKMKSKSRHPPKNARSVTLDEYWALGSAAGGGEESDDSFVVPDEHAPHPPLSQQTRDIAHLRRVTVHMDIHPLPAGIAFPNTTYVGRGWLHELINLLPGAHDVPSPQSCTMMDCTLFPDMSIAAFTTCLDAVYDKLRNLVLGASGPSDPETCGSWRSFFHALCQHLSWILVKSEDEAQVALITDTESLAQRLSSLMEEPVEVLPEDETPNPLVAQVQWFLVEASCRLVCHRRRRHEIFDPDLVATTVKALMGKLWDFSFGDSAFPIDLTKDWLTTVSEGQQIAELWICLLNLANDKVFEASFLPPGASFWTLYLHVLQTKGLQTPLTDLKAREAMWRSFFTLCALSQFSLHGNSSMTPRLSASWQVIASVLERAPLASDPTVDKSLPHRILRKRDEYVRVLVSRCLWLNLKWRWRLDVDDTSLVFNRLLDVFKSRRFASLEDEPSDYPSFLLHNNLLLLHESNRSDTAFTIFLKLVAKAAEELRNANPELNRSPTIPPRLKKILSLAVPVGSVPFTKANPPSMRELSMLYNRFSAVAVAIYLEPTVANLKYRLSNARRYVNFKDTDDETRRACIRGAMQLGILLRHLDLPLTDILDWMGQMTDILIDEYRAAETAKGVAAASKVSQTWVVISLQLILGGVRKILETSSMNPQEGKPKYPDPALLQGPWVTSVFSRTTSLSSIISTGDQIRRFVQAFLDARALVLPKPRRPQPRVIAEESQESQYDYDQFDLDLDDPELLAALGEDLGPSEHSQNKEKDKAVCEVIDKVILSAIYRLVCKHFSDPTYQDPGELHFADADNWIDCWVGCANVVVQNGKRDWNFYFSFGPQSWETIPNATRRRRVGLRFMYTLLQLDSPAYLTYTDRFINVLLECLATRAVTLEHDYASLLFSVDRLHHPLLHDLPVGDPHEDGDYHLTRHEFSEKRLPFVEKILQNLSDNLRAEEDGDRSLTANNHIYLTSVIGFLDAMKDILDYLEVGTIHRAMYLDLCRAVSALLASLPPLGTHERLKTSMSWLRDVS
ncbi:Mus7/MMS22 family-domain-containing protein [Lenzites betulinus]|nr:Mus7/MMS22 family-domain-containing protein [Lenzites betulinus]